MTMDSDPEGRRLPIKLDSTSNGEFAPIPLDAVGRRANGLAQERASDNARRTGMGRRRFMVSACGAASTLLAFNAANAAAGRTGGRFELEATAALDPEVAAERLGGREFVFDVQGHFVGANGLGRTGLGSTWRFAMRDPDSAAHILGKLLVHVGERNVLYGSDCIWYGSPQDQIQALRTFQIDESLRERHGYPALTPALRAGIFGLNAARVYGIDVEEVLQRARGDAVERRRAEYRERPDPHFTTYGPRTRREYLANLRARGGDPV